MKKLVSMFLLSLISIVMLGGCSENKGVTTDGSSSMEKVIGSLGEAFQMETGIQFTYNPTGSSSGIQAVLEGRSDIGLSSRYLKEEEKANGLKEKVLAYDGIAIIVHPNNPIDNLDLDTLYKIFTGEITNWKEIGGEDKDIVLIGREAGSGTRDGFESITKTKELCQYRQVLSSTGDVITTVSNNSNAIGYASIASLKDNVKVLSINGIQVSATSIKDGSYLIQRPFVLVVKSDTQLSDEAQKFYDFITSEDAVEIIFSNGVVSAY